MAGFLKNPDGSLGLEQFGIYLCHLSWGKEMLHGVAKKTYRCIFFLTLCLDDISFFEPRLQPPSHGPNANEPLHLSLTH